MKIRKVIKQLRSAFSNKSIGSFLLAEENVISDSIGLVLTDLQVRRVNSVETTLSIRSGTLSKCLSRKFYWKRRLAEEIGDFISKPRIFDTVGKAL